MSLLLLVLVLSAVPAVGSRNIQTKMFAKPWHLEIGRSLFSHKVLLKQTKSYEKKEFVCVKYLFTAVFFSVTNYAFYTDVFLMPFLLNFHLVFISV